MLKILQTIGGFFVTGGPIAMILAKIGVKFTSKAFIIGLQFARLVLYFGAFIAFLSAIVVFSVKLLNYINDFLNNLNSFFISDNILSWFYNFKECGCD